MIDPAVRDVLVSSQRLGFLGDRDIDEVIEHARAFVAAMEQCTGTVADLGSGGGIPGLVIAHDRPDLMVQLVDRRSKRTDFLDRMVHRLGWSERVRVICADAAVLPGGDEAVDVAVARGLGPPESTLSLAAAVVKPAGLIIISEPPDGGRWPASLLSELGVTRLDDDRGPVSVFRTSPIRCFT